jgi:CheY-like chemotaxis protein
MIFTERITAETEPLKTILIVDDEAPIRLLMSCILRQAGYHVLVAHDGIEGAQRIQSAERIDLLLTDISMPGMNGVELARVARSARPGLPVVFASGSLDCFPDTTHHLRCLAKPFTASELIGAVEGALTAAEFCMA